MDSVKYEFTRPFKELKRLQSKGLYHTLSPAEKKSLNDHAKQQRKKNQTKNK